MPITNLWNVKWMQVLQKMGKTKLHAIKICELLLDMCLGCNFAPPNKNRVYENSSQGEETFTFLTIQSYLEKAYLIGFKGFCN